MNDRTDRGADRAETARQNDDSEIIDAAAQQETPSFGGSHGGNIARDVGGRDEVKEEVLEEDSVTRVRADDKPPEADLPRYNQK
jgi:hypothetical protein